MILRIHTKKIIYVVVGVFILLVLYTLKNTGYFTRVSGFVLSIILFYMADIFFELKFRTRHYLIFIIVSAAGILMSPLYSLSPIYDKVLHFVSPILLCVLAFYLANKAEVKFSTKLLITFSVIVASLAIFEIVEYLLDQLFDMKLQGVFIRDYSGVSKLKIIMDRNDDTMIDLIFGTAGSIFFVFYTWSTFIYKKYIEK
jgi:hypothetical protein